MKQLVQCLLFLLFFASALVNAEAYTTPKAFMDLYFSFSGSQEPDYPKGQKTIAYSLWQSQNKREKEQVKGPLLLVLDSSIYIYDDHHRLLYKKLLKINRASGFYELSAIAQIGPAVAYLAQIKENGDKNWQPALANLLKTIKRARLLNASVKGNWLDKANIKSWKPHQREIRTMIDYALSMAGNYILSIQQGDEFNLVALQNNFLRGNKQFPIPFDNVIVATHMLIALETMASMQDEIKKLKLNWPKARVLIRNTTGANVGAGLTLGSNWMAAFINALSSHRLATDRLFIVPYAKVYPEVGETLLPANVYQYYAKTIWGELYHRSQITAKIFNFIPSIYLAERAILPGDYQYSSAAAINDFMMRMKFSLMDPREFLANGVSFWMIGELEAKGWDVGKIDIPGLTTGFPPGFNGYPAINPLISEIYKRRKGA